MENQKPENQDPPESPGEPPSPPTNLWSRQRWLARFSFSFLIVAVYLAYTGFNHPELGQGRKILYYAGAALAFGLFLMGTRERHRPQR